MTLGEIANKGNSKYFLCVKWKIVRVTDARMKDQKEKTI